MTVVFYTYFSENITRDSFRNILHVLPEQVRDRIGRFIRWQDALASLYGRLMLQEGFSRFGFAEFINELEYTAHNKPYLKNNTLSFNISHSGDYVICAMSNDTDLLGVDIEEIKTIDLNDFKDIWTIDEWKLIAEDGDVNTFYNLWTRKEAVIKADGRGLSLALKEIDVTVSSVSVNDKLYFLKKLDVNSGYAAHLASSRELSVIDLVYLNVHPNDGVRRSTTG